MARIEAPGATTQGAAAVFTSDVLADPAGYYRLRHLLREGANHQCPDTEVIRPKQYRVRDLPILIHQFPAAEATCRVDCSLTLTLDLAQLSRDQSTYSRVGSWKWLRLPAGAFSKGKKSDKATEASAESTLTLVVSVVCSSDHRRIPFRCPACCEREDRLSLKQGQNGASAPPTAAAGASVAVTSNDRHGNLVVFGNKEFLDFSKGRVVLRPRVTCYSRHHGEYTGFLLTFTMVDSNGHIVGSGTTPPIQIIGKTASRGGTARKRRHSEAESSDDDSSDGATHRRGEEPRNDVSTLGVPRMARSSSTSFNPEDTVHPYPPYLGIRGRDIDPIHPWGLTLTAPALSAGGGALMYPELVSGTMPSKALTILDPRPAAGETATSLSSQDIRHVVFRGTDALRGLSTTPHLLASISSIAPKSGSITGGVEVVVLGANFTHDLEVMFGNRIAITERWSSSALKCIAPPSTFSGDVVVGIKGARISVEEALQRFEYQDTREVELKNLARRVVSQKLTGVDPASKTTAMCILASYLANPDVPLLAPTPSNSSRFRPISTSLDLEKQVLAFLSLLDEDEDSPGSVTTTQTLSCVSESGKNLLHLSSALGFDKLVADLLRRGILLHGRDVNRYTALDFAEFYGMDGCVRVLGDNGVGVRCESPAEDDSEGSWDADHRDPAVPMVDTGPDYSPSAHSASIESDASRTILGGVDRAMGLTRTQDSLSFDSHLSVPKSAAIGEPMRGHTDVVLSVAFSPDGKRIASGSGDTTVRLWDVLTGTAIGEPMRGHTNYVRSVAFSPDGTHIASGLSDKTIRLWDVSTGMAVGVPMQGHIFWANSVAFSPDGTRVASCSDDCTVRLWDVSTGAAIGEPMRGHTDWVRSVAFSPDGTRVASCSDDCTVRLWDVSTGSAIGVPKQGHTRPVNSVAFSPDGKYIASGSDDKTLRLWGVSYAAELSKPTYGYILRVQQIGHEHEWHIDFDDKEEEEEEDGAVVHTATFYVIDNDETLIHCGAVGSGSSILAARDDACRAWLPQHLASCSIHSFSSCS